MAPLFEGDTAGKKLYNPPLLLQARPDRRKSQTLVIIRYKRPELRGYSLHR